MLAQLGSLDEVRSAALPRACPFGRLEPHMTPRACRCTSATAPRSVCPSSTTSVTISAPNTSRLVCYVGVIELQRTARSHRALRLSPRTMTCSPSHSNFPLSACREVGGAGADQAPLSGFGNDLALVYVGHDWRDKGVTEQRYTFRDLDLLSNRLANTLVGVAAAPRPAEFRPDSSAHTAKCGVARGDRVAIFIPQSPEAAVAHIRWGCSRRDARDG
jgi:hypothetical protein